LDEDYFERIEAVEFAVRFDDGKDFRGFAWADVVLIGISRTSKTPLSLYLANQKIKAANVPLMSQVYHHRKNCLRFRRVKSSVLTVSAD
jgi:regulator of PEP synthase PpsR (kinase-PPPase family)